MRVCRRKNDGRIVEAQSNDTASMEPLYLNAMSHGQLAEFDFVIMSDSDVMHAIDEQEKHDRHRIAERRYQKEISGFVSPRFGDVPTTRDFQTAVLHKLVQHDLGIAPEIVAMKIGAEFRDMTRADLIDLAREIFSHVQSCFDEERQTIQQGRT